MSMSNVINGEMLNRNVDFYYFCFHLFRTEPSRAFRSFYIFTLVMHVRLK